MSTAPSLSALRSSKHVGGSGGGGGGGSSSSSSADPAWTSALSGNCSGPGPGPGPGSGSSAGSTKPFVHAVPPSDPLRQANRLPIKVLKMLTARTGHILHPEYLQPLPSTPVSPIELDAKKSPLALLAQTCSQIGKPDPSPSSKLSSVASNGGGAGSAGGGSGGDKDAKSGPLKLSDIGVKTRYLGECRDNENDFLKRLSVVLKMSLYTRKELLVSYGNDSQLLTIMVQTTLHMGRKNRITINSVTEKNEPIHHI